MNFARYGLLVLAFFPSVTFGLIYAEIFPWATFFALISLRFIDRNDAVLTSILITLFLLSAAWSMTTNPQSDAIRSLAAFLNPILVFVALLNVSDEWVRRGIKIGKRVLIFLLCLGVGQLLGLLAPIDGLLSTLVPRASASALTNLGGRGVTLLSSEPSRAGVEIIYLYLLYRLTMRPTRSLIPEDFGILLFIVVAIKAAQPFAFSVLVLGILIVKRWYHVVILLLLLPLASLIELGSSGSRVFRLAEGISQLGFSEAVYYVANESGHRLLSIYAFFKYGLYFPLGGGIGNWALTSIDAIELTGVDISGFRYFIIHGGGNIIGVRGSGMLSNLMLDVGIAVTGFFLFWIFRLTRRYRQTDHVTRAVLTILLLKISFIGSVGEPIPWVVTALVLRHNYLQLKAKESERLEPTAA